MSYNYQYGPDKFVTELDVRHTEGSRWWEIWLTIYNENWAWCFEEFLFGFGSEEEANLVMNRIIASMQQPPGELA